MIASMEKGYSEMEMSERVTFDEVLRECDVSEQICYLEEHATEDIPYFYIADVFHSWASINSKYYLKEEDGSSSVTQVNKKDFESPVLCKELWEKMKNGVIPFDVSVRALCLLAATNKKNARQIAANVRADPNDMLQLYTTYIHSLEEKGLPEGDTVPLADVAGSTLFLLKMSNDASSGFLGLRRGSLTQGVDRDLWCGNFGVLPSAVRNRTADTASAFAEALSEKLKCPVDK
ncbi:hypothetical protein AGDE_02449 [Angomonas deanei]|nr:hypothetical protein AGDE_02449 [Angomonas deanei]|eukprot:EPY41475.1 hypothetical protein AGDE_02449 [Angomonas deanei]